MDRGRRRTQSLTLGIESSETGCVPWVWLESVIRCISQAVRSPVRTWSTMKGPSHLGLSLSFSCLAGVELIRQRCNFWHVLLCFGIFEPAVDRMRNGLLPRHALPPRRPNYPADQARLLFLRTCALKVSHELCRRAKLPLRRTP